MWDVVRPNASAPARGHRQIAGGHALAIVACVLAVMFVGATLPTPLYPLYRLEFGFGDFMLTLIYAVYVLGNLIALLFFGRLSDQVGRRSVSLVAIGFGLASTLAFLMVDAAAWLFAARVLSGLATGLASGTATAWIAELQPRGDRAAAASIAVMANMGGTALGPLLAGTLAAFAPWPLRLCYVVYSALLVVAAIAALIAPDCSQSCETIRRPVAESSARRAARHPHYFCRASGNRFRYLLLARVLLRLASGSAQGQPARAFTGGRRSGRL
jgi:MFS family permease